MRVTESRRAVTAQAAKLQTLLDPVVQGLGYELLGVQFLGAGRPTLRLYIDSPNGITVEDCEAVSRQIGAVLDVEDVMTGHYTLEVSSPGLERPLFKPAHYHRFIGEAIRLRLSEFVQGRRKLTGTLQSVDEEGVTIDADGQSYRIPFHLIAKANLKPDMENLLRARRSAARQGL